MSTQTNTDYLLESLPDFSRAEILAVVEYMRERHVEPTVENVQHGLDADEIKRDLLSLGINISNDGRRNQIAPTTDQRGRVVLTFRQIKKLIEMARATD